MNFKIYWATFKKGQELPGKQYQHKNNSRSLIKEAVQSFEIQR